MSKTQFFYQQKPVAPGFYIHSEFFHVLKPVYHDISGEGNMKWFANERIKNRN